MPSALDTFERVHPTTRAEWRRWLEQHHTTSPGVWLISWKAGSGQPRVAYAEAVEEALCFGWIDSRPNKLDRERFMQLLSPRQPRSAWSKLNQTRVEKLIAAGLMTQAGLDKINAAKMSGRWTELDAVENLAMPEDLTIALQADNTAEINFSAFSPSSKKSILFWIQGAKRSETRAKRIAETVALAAKNLKANHWRQ